jgi:hypothetical protein
VLKTNHLSPRVEQGAFTGGTASGSIKQFSLGRLQWMGGISFSVRPVFVLSLDTSCTDGVKACCRCSRV